MVIAVMDCRVSQKRIKPEEKDQSELLRVSNETTALKAEIVRLKSSMLRRTSEKSGTIEESEILKRLQEQEEEITVLKDMVGYQVRFCTSLISRESLTHCT